MPRIERQLNCSLLEQLVTVMYPYERLEEMESGCSPQEITTVESASFGKLHCSKPCSDLSK